MPKAIQADRQLELTTPLGADVLLPRRMTGVERLSRAFEYRLELLSTDPGIDFSAILGERASLRLSLAGGKDERFFHGVMTDFEQMDSSDKRYARYEMTLRPWLWFLTRTSDCRIFQEQTVPEIVAAVFQELGFSDFEDRLTETYSKREYCVQYRETDFDFVSRLLEEEGIYYFFEHEEDLHTMILADDNHGLDSLGSIPYSFDANRGQGQQPERIFGWRLQQQLQPVQYVLNDYDFKAPKKSLLSPSAQERSHAGAEYEIYDYPGRYQVSGDGEHFSRRRIEELQARFERVTGSSNVRILRAGALFDLSQHPRDDQNKTFLVTDIEYQLASNAFEMGSGSVAEETYACRITALDAQQPFRPERLTPRPVVRGPQTAVVTGPSGDEIHTDEHGRVKCQFHWDRYGKRDENSSCWIRVSQAWAGKEWGAMALPRIGQEVIVNFLEGDPDRPIITGRVYNGNQKPPYALPANKTQSGIKTRSTPNGGADNRNEIRFEDKKGAEQLFIHAEKDRDIEVKNDETHWVGKDRSKTIDGDETSHIKGKRTEIVDKDETITVTGNRKKTVLKDETTTITGNQTHTVTGNQTNTIVGNRTHTITGNKTETITGTLTQVVTGGVNLITPAAMTVTAAGGYTLLAPNTTTLDMVDTSYGHISASAFVTGFSTRAFDAASFGVSVTVKALEVNTIGTRLEAKAIDHSTDGVTISKAGAKIKSGGIAIYTFGMNILS